MANYLQWIGCVFGASGALVLAMNRPWSGWGFVLFLVSNLCWVPYGLQTAAPGLVLMQLVMTGTSMLGVYRWLIRSNSSRAAPLARANVIPLPRREPSVRKAST